MIKRILVALSGTPFTPSAVAHAIELARMHEAEVTGVTLEDFARLSHVGPIPIGGGAAAHELAEHRIHITEERIEHEITAFEAKCREAGTPHSVVRETGSTLEQFMGLWRYHDLTIIGLRGLFQYGVLENPDGQVSRLIAKGVRPIIAVAEEYRPIRRAMIAYNGSMESAKAMKRFVQMRLWPSTEIRIACFGFSDRDADRVLSAASTYCQAHGHTPETASLPGDATDAMLLYAHECEVDLIVMGMTARSKLMKLILGDTALNAIQRSEVPLFLAQ